MSKHKTSDQEYIFGILIFIVAMICVAYFVIVKTI